MYLAIGVEPTNDTALMPGWARMASTASLSPCTTFSTPSGSPASLSSSAMRMEADGTFSEGFRMKVLPQAIATGNIHSGTMTGKLNGVMPAHTPTGWRTVWQSTPVPTSSECSPLRRWGMPQANSTTSMPRCTEPIASGSVLPCSSVTSPASSFWLACRSCRNFCITRARRRGGVSRHPGKAAVAALTAASMSAALQSGTRRATLPVAGFITSPWRAADARWCLPPIQRSTWPGSTGWLISAPVQLTESPAFGRGQVALRGPAGGAGDALQPPVGAAHPGKQPRRQRRHHRIRPRPARAPAPRRERQALGPGAQRALELPLAQLAHEIGQRDLHRAHDAALVAEGRGVGQVERVLQPHVGRRQHRSHGTGIDPAVGVAADALVDRAMVHARAAAYAAQHGLQLAADQPAATAVEQDDVEVRGAFALAVFPDAGRDRDVVGYGLPGAVRGQEPHERRHVLQRRHHLLDA